MPVISRLKSACTSRGSSPWRMAWSFMEHPPMVRKVGKTASILGAVVGKFHGDGGAGRHLGAGGNVLVGGCDVGTILVGTGDQEVEAVALGILLGVDQGHAGEVRHLHGLVGRLLAEVEH